MKFNAVKDKGQRGMTEAQLTAIKIPVFDLI